MPPPSTDGNSSTSGGASSLSSGAIAGIIIGCIIASPFILCLGAYVALHLHMNGCCRKNRVESLPDESPRLDMETALGGKDESPEKQRVNPKDGPENILTPAQEEANAEMNATGAQLLSHVASNVESTKGGLLPLINTDNLAAAKGWQEVDEGMTNRPDATIENPGEEENFKITNK